MCGCSCHIFAAILAATLGDGAPTAAFSWQPEVAEAVPASMSFARATEATVLTTTDGSTNWYQEVGGGEARFQGLRRSENILNTGNTLADMTAQNGVTVLGDEATYPGSSGGELLTIFNTPVVPTQRICFSVGMRLVSGAGTHRIDLRFTGSGGPTTITQDITVTGTLQRFAVFGSGVSGDNFVQIRIRNSATPAASVVEVTDLMLHVVQDGTSIPEDAISPNTEYNAGVDGVQYLATANGNTVDANGVVTEAAGSAIVGGAYIGEPASTNQMPTVDLSDAAWTKTNLTVVDNGVTNLGLREYELDAGVSPGDHRVLDNAASGAAGVAYAIAKAGTGNFFIVRRGASTSDDYACFNLSTGLVTEEGGGISSSFIVDLGDDWYLCGVETSDASTVVHVGVSDTGTPGTSVPSFTGSNETILLCHVQYESLDFPSSPIVTSGAASSRNADQLFGTGWIASAPYSVFVDVTAPDVFSSENRIVRLDTGTSNDLEYDGSGNILLSADTGLSVAPSGAVSEGDRDTMALRYAANDAALAVSDKTTVTDGSVTVNSNAEGSLEFGGAGRLLLHSANSYDVGLTDLQLEDAEFIDTGN